MRIGKLDKRTSRKKYNQDEHLVIMSTLGLFLPMTPGRIARNRKALFQTIYDAESTHVGRSSLT